MGQGLKIGSLCTGYGGLDLAVEAYFNAETIWCAEIDKYASQVIEQRFDIPNHGNIKEIDWASLEPIDILTAGYPCQPFSHAGYRKGTDDDRHIGLVSLRHSNDFALYCAVSKLIEFGI